MSRARGGVGAQGAAQLAELGVESVLDLVTTYPRRYIDRTRQADVSDLEVGDEAAVLASVQSARARRARTGRAVVDVVVRDETGRLKVVFFNQPWRAKQLEAGTEAIFFGKVGRVPGHPPDGQPRGRRRGRRDAGPPDPADPARLPGLGQGGADQLGDRRVRRGGAGAGGRVRRPAARRSGARRSTCGTGPTAFGAIHLPESFDVVEPARRRLVFDELFRLQLALVLRRRAFEVNARALRHDVSPREVTGGRGRHAGGPLPRPACPTS